MRSSLVEAHCGHRVLPWSRTSSKRTGVGVACGTTYFGVGFVPSQGAGLNRACSCDSRGPSFPLLAPRGMLRSAQIRHGFRGSPTSKECREVPSHEPPGRLLTRPHAHTAWLIRGRSQRPLPYQGPWGAKAGANEMCVCVWQASSLLLSRRPSPPPPPRIEGMDSRSRRAASRCDGESRHTTSLFARGPSGSCSGHRR